MIPTWTIMALSLGGPLEGQPPTTALMFPSYAECSAQINTLRDVFEGQGLDVQGVHCEGTNAPSASPFPKKNPRVTVSR
jgi:hypothetical protein